LDLGGYGVLEVDSGMNLMIGGGTMVDGLSGGQRFDYSGKTSEGAGWGLPG